MSGQRELTRHKCAGQPHVDGVEETSEEPLDLKVDRGSLGGRKGCGEVG